MLEARCVIGAKPRPRRPARRDKSPLPRKRGDRAGTRSRPPHIRQRRRDVSVRTPDERNQERRGRPWPSALGTAQVPARPRRGVMLDSLREPQRCGRASSTAGTRQRAREVRRPPILRTRMRRSRPGRLRPPRMGIAPKPVEARRHRRAPQPPCRPPARLGPPCVAPGSRGASEVQPSAHAVPAEARPPDTEVARLVALAVRSHPAPPASTVQPNAILVFLDQADPSASGLV